MGSNLVPSIDSSGQRITTKNKYKKAKYKYKNTNDTLWIIRCITALFLLRK